MKQLTQTLYHISIRFLHLLAAFFLLLLFAVNLILTCYSTDMTSQKVLMTWDSPVLNLGLLLPSLLLLLAFQGLIRRNLLLWKKILLVASPCAVALTGMVLLVFSKTVPAADALSVYGCAEQLAAGDLSCIHPTESYLSYYPQQIGLAAFWEILIRLMRLLPISLRYYHLLKVGYIVMTCGILFFLYKITDLLWEDNEADCFCLLLCGINAPFIMYSSFLYSEVPSFLAISFGFYNLLSLIKEKTKKNGLQALLSILGMSLGVLLRKNSLIFVIAVVLVLVFEWFRQKRGILLITCAGILLLSMTILPCTIKLYELRAGNQLKSGVPAMSYFAMGMQEAPRAAGWYNGFNFNTYQETGMNEAETVQISREAIAARISYFREHPGYFLSFYAEKFLSQWADGTFASRQATLATYGGRSAFFQELYEGKYSSAYIQYCNLYQTLIYLGAFFCVIAVMPRREHLFPYLLFIGVFGGFLFHMIWEANSRYIFSYGLCLLPYGAVGLKAACQRLTSLLWRRVQKEEPQEVEKDTATERQDQGTK